METYQTTDFKTVAYLKWCGFNIIDTQKLGTRGQVVQFYFEDSDDLQDARFKFANGNNEDPGIRMLRCIDSVKTLIHQ